MLSDIKTGATYKKRLTAYVHKYTRREETTHANISVLRYFYYIVIYYFQHVTKTNTHVPSEKTHHNTFIYTTIRCYIQYHYTLLYKTEATVASYRRLCHPTLLSAPAHPRPARIYRATQIATYRRVRLFHHHTSDHSTSRCPPHPSVCKTLPL